MPTARSVYILQRLWGHDDHHEIRGVAAHSESLLSEVEALAEHYQGEVVYGAWGRHGQPVVVLDDKGRTAATFYLTLHDLLP